MAATVAVVAALLAAGLATATAATGAVQNLHRVSVGADDATIAWDAMPTATRYRVYWSTKADMPSTCAPTCNKIAPTDLDNPSVTLSRAFEGVDTVVPGEKYYVKVSAINASGKTITGYSSALTVDLTGEPAAPEVIPATVENLRSEGVTANDATIRWNRVPTAQKYRVYWSTNATMPGTCEPTCRIIEPADLANPSVTLSGAFAGIDTIRAGEKYFIKVSAINDSGKTITGWQAEGVKVDLSGEPAAPTSTLAAIVDNGSGTSAKATVRFDPARSGQATALQVRTLVTSNTPEVDEDETGSKKGPWKTIATGKQDPSGKTVFALSDPLEVSHTYRATSGSITSNEVTYAATPVTKNTGLATVYLNTNEGHGINTRSRYFEGSFSMAASSKISACTAVAPVAKSTMKGRGNYSWSFSKKSFTLKIDKKQDLCGMGSSKKWALVANAYDKSLLRSAVAFNLGKHLDNMAWTPKATPVDLYVNGSYRGSYSLVARVGIDPLRVNIDELKADGQATDPGHLNNQEPAITGGYLLEWDFRKGADRNVTVGSRGYVGIKDPEDDYDKRTVKTNEGISAKQVNYIDDYLDDADKALFGSKFKDNTNGWKKYIDIDSAVDYYIGMEMMKPVDGNMWASVYMYKPRGDKLYMGPMWDFDLAAGSANRSGNTVGSSGWYLRNKITTSAKQSQETWFNRLNQDSDFTNAVKKRWKEVYPELSSSAFVDEQAGLLKTSATENFKKWSVKERVSSSQVVKGSWNAEISYLRTWMSSRRSWMNGQLK